MPPPARSDSGPLFLAIDQGGQSSRALVYDARARVVSRARRELRAHRDGEDRCEYDPDTLLTATSDAIVEAVARAGARRGDIVAAGLATQRSNIACWDRDSGAPLAPVIAWQDRRAHRELQRLQSAAPRIREITGLALSAHYGASKLKWCLDHLPAVQAAHREGRLAWGPMASFLLHRLLREHPLCADPVNAARTLLLDIDRCDWSAEALELFGLPREPLPPCTPTHHRYGMLDAGGLDIPLVVATGDQAAALYAFGPPTDGSLHITVGTGAFVQRLAGTRRRHDHRLLDSVVYRDADACHYAVEGTVNGAGSALEWLAAREATGAATAELTAALPGWLADIERPPLFLNGVAGLGTPFMTPAFASRFIGGGGAPEHAVAVVESIAFLLQLNMEELARLNLPVSQLRIGGGLARLDGFCQRLANLSGASVQRPPGIETTGRGLAWLLRSATLPDAGADPHWRDPEGMEIFEPRVDKSLESRYRRWKAALEEALEQEGKQS